LRSPKSSLFFLFSSSLSLSLFFFFSFPHLRSHMRKLSDSNSSRQLSVSTKTHLRQRSSEMGLRHTAPDARTSSGALPPRLTKSNPRLLDHTDETPDTPSAEEAPARRRKLSPFVFFFLLPSSCRHVLSGACSRHALASSGRQSAASAHFTPQSARGPGPRLCGGHLGAAIVLRIMRTVAKLVKSAYLCPL
jgi:hypothetical protein